MGGAAAVLLAGLGAWTAWTGWSGLRAAQAQAQAAEALLAAADLAVGPERDAALDAAQTALQRRLAYRSRDVLAWSRLAEVRLLQAASATVGAISPALLEASLKADARVEALGGAGARDYARRSYAQSLLGADPQAAARWLAASYRLEPGATGLAQRRLVAGAQVWPHLDAETRAAVRAEACSAAKDELLLVGEAVAGASAERLTQPAAAQDAAEVGSAVSRSLVEDLCARALRAE